jgi:carboxyl-terminal processing protease
VTSTIYRRVAGVLFLSLALGLAYLAGVLSVSGGAAAGTPGGSASADAASLVDEAWQLVDSHFFGTLPTTQTRVYAAIRGLLGALNDPYTVLIEPPAAKLESDQLRGEFGGIGADLRRDAAGNTLLAPYPDGPAARVGALDGDRLDAIDGAPVLSAERLDEIETRLRGDIGSHVRLTLTRGDRSFDLDVAREQIAPPSVLWRLVDGAPDIGYISIRVFTDRTANEVGTAITTLRQQGIGALVLDVRDNGGGLLQAAIDVAGHFVDGVVMIETKRDGGQREYVAPASGTARDLPLVVLVNHSTASASEIVAGALRDRERAILVGEQTFGKGSVQSIYPLADGSSLHVTTAVWLTPSRRSLNGQSLFPDIEVARSADERAAGRDPVLDRAVAYLHGQP